MTGRSGGRIAYFLVSLVLIPEELSVSFEELPVPLDGLTRRLSQAAFGEGALR